jgi:hypothetical protein
MYFNIVDSLSFSFPFPLPPSSIEKFHYYKHVDQCILKFLSHSQCKGICCCIHKYAVL